MTWSANCVIIYTNVENQIPAFEITETKLYVRVATLLTQDNTKLLQLPVVTLLTQDNTKLLHQDLKEQLTGINIYQNQNY